MASYQVMTDETSRASKARKIIAILEEFVQPLKRKTILDVGAGSGIVGGELSRYGNDVYANDVSSLNLRESDLSFLIADARKLPYKDESFDVVICNHLLEHVRDQQGVMLELRRVLKQGGYLYLSQDNRLWPIEPHYRLPFLSYLPRRLANSYVRWLRGVETYDDISLPTLQEFNEVVFRTFDNVTDMTGSLLRDPEKYYTTDLIPNPIQSLVTRIPRRFFQYIRHFLPGWIYVIEK